MRTLDCEECGGSNDAASLDIKRPLNEILRSYHMAKPFPAYHGYSVLVGLL